MQRIRLLVSNAKSNYYKQQRTVQHIKNNLEALIGKPLSQLNLPLGEKLYINKQFAHKNAFANVHSQQLLYRPDVRQAEFSLQAANANIGVARARMFPSISLTGNAGYVSLALDNLFNSANHIWSFIPSINLPLFDAGKRKAGVKISELQKQMAVETYQATIKNAFKEVSNALITKKTLEQQYRAERGGSNASTEILRVIMLQLQEGFVDTINVQEAEITNFTTQQSLLFTKLQLLTNYIDLYTSLGGGLDSSVK